MRVPYSAEFIGRLLRGISDDRLAAAKPQDFQLWPAKVAVSSPVIKELTATHHRTGKPIDCGRGDMGRFCLAVPAMRRFAKFLDFDPATGCVVWTGGTTSGRGHTSPYGSFWDQGRRWFAHRWAAKYIHGLDVEGYQVDHCCPHTGGKSNTLCVAHVQALTFHEHVAFEQARKFIYVQVGLEEADPVWEPDPEAPPFYRPPAWFLELCPDYRLPPLAASPF